MMNKILFISQDPGGTNVLIPIIKGIGNKYHFDVLAKDSAGSIYRRRGIPFTDIGELISSCDIEILEKILKTFSPDIVVTGTCATDFLERNIWMAARSLRIKSVAVLDSWCFYGLRFSNYTFENDDSYISSEQFPYLPDQIFVMDEYAKAQMIAEGIDPNLIEIIGQPFLEELREVYKNISQIEIESYKKQVVGNNKKKIIVFASDHLKDCFLPSGIEYWGYDEESIFYELYESMIETCDNPEGYVIVIRPHPKEAAGKWDTIARMTEGKGIQIVIDGTTKAELVIAAAELVVGMWTMLLLEADLADKRILSVQIGAKRRAEFMLTDRKLIEPIWDKTNLKKQMREYFLGNDNIGKVRWSIKGDAVNKAILKLKELMDN